MEIRNTLTHSLRSPEAAEELTRQGALSLDVLVWALQRAPETVQRRHAAYALGLLRDRRSVDPLSFSLCKDEPIVRETAAAALGAIRDARAVRPLLRALADNTAVVRRCAADSLVEIGGDSVEALIQELWDPRPGVRESVIETLARIGLGALPQLLTTYRCAGGQVSRDSEKALRRLGDRETLPRRLLATPTLTPRQKADTLAQLLEFYRLPDTVAYCRWLLGDPSEAVRNGAKAALTDLEGRSLLRPTLPHPASDRRQLLRPVRHAPADPPDVLLHAIETREG